MRETDKKSKIMWDVAIIGGGPAGMMAAGTAAERGANVILIEKNKNLGNKLLISGGGRCNVTNNELDVRKFLSNFQESSKHLFSAFSQWNVKNTLSFFEQNGMKTKVENEGRVFPVSDSSRSVLDVLVSYMKKGKVTILLDSTVSEINHTENEITSIVLSNGQKIFARSYILATGGKSYPETGSTGDGFVWLKKMGHNVIKPDSALVPVIIQDSWVKDLQGVTLTDIKINLFQDNKKIESKVGKILFTHFGVSGPTVLNMSRKINELIPYGNTTLSVDLMPRHDFSTLNDALQKLLLKEKSKKIKNALPDLIPSSITTIVLDKASIDPEKTCHSITREERINLMKTLKDIRMNISGLLSPENAIVSSGGVNLEEVDSKTMKSKIIKNLYLTGDILNINRPSGGYSLQLCWTTGFVAGRHSFS